MILNVVNIPTTPTTYIIAVSGGVDSMVLLHSLRRFHPQHTYIVAHVNHGMRKTAHYDEELVKKVAIQHGLRFESTNLHLGEKASETLARTKRYEYLRALQKKHKAEAIITAHHQDDVIETCFLNLVRGTGHRGLVSLDSRAMLIRPLLNMPKSTLIRYAQLNGIQWNEDNTNTDTTILRNKIRHEVVPEMSELQRKTLLHIIDTTRKYSKAIDREIQQLNKKLLHRGQWVIRKSAFIQLPHDVSREVIYGVLRDVGVKDIDKKTVERLVIAIKTLVPGKKIQAIGVEVLLTKRSARFKKHSQTDEKDV